MAETDTYNVGDRVKFWDPDVDLVGTVIDVQNDARTGQWLTIQWDEWLANADQVEPA